MSSSVKSIYLHLGETFIGALSVDSVRRRETMMFKFAAFFAD